MSKPKQENRDFFVSLSSFELLYKHHALCNILRVTVYMLFESLAHLQTNFTCLQNWFGKMWELGVSFQSSIMGRFSPACLAAALSLKSCVHVLKCTLFSHSL